MQLKWCAFFLYAVMGTPTTLKNADFQGFFSRICNGTLLF